MVIDSDNSENEGDGSPSEIRFSSEEFFRRNTRI